MLYNDYRWWGAPAAVEAAVAGQPNVLGPVTLDGVAYVAVRSVLPLATPPGLTAMGPELAARIVGVWADTPA